MTRLCTCIVSFLVLLCSAVACDLPAECSNGGVYTVVVHDDPQLYIRDAYATVMHLSFTNGKLFPVEVIDVTVALQDNAGDEVLTHATGSMEVEPGETQEIYVHANTMGIAHGERVRCILKSITVMHHCIHDANGSTEQGPFVSNYDIVGKWLYDGNSLQQPPLVSLSQHSPSGASIPGVHEVLRLDLYNPNGHQVWVNAMAFELESSDHADTDWNTYGVANLLPQDFDAQFIPFTGVPIDDGPVNWDLFKDPSCVHPCLPGDLVMAVCLDLRADMQDKSFIIPANSFVTVAIHMDTTGISSTQDDTLQLNSVSVTAGPYRHHDLVLGHTLNY